MLSRELFIFCWSEMISKQLSEGGLGFVDLATTPFNILNYLHLYIDIVWRYFLQVKCRKNPHTTKTVCWYSYKNVLKQFIHTVSYSKNTVSFYLVLSRGKEEVFFNISGNSWSTWKSSDASSVISESIINVLSYIL